MVQFTACTATIDLVSFSYHPIMDTNHKNLNPFPPLEVLIDDENECLQPAVGSDRGSKTCPLMPFLFLGAQIASL